MRSSSLWRKRGSRCIVLVSLTALAALLGILAAADLAVVEKPAGKAGGDRAAPAADSSTAKGPAQRPSPFDRAPAYHWQQTMYADWLGHDRPPDGPPKVLHVEEGWALRGVGRRVEVRDQSKLLCVVVDTPRWRFVHDVVRNSVAAHPSQLKTPAMTPFVPMLWTRDEMVRWSERNRAASVSEKHVLRGKEAEKITLKCLADPAVDGDWPIHQFIPEKHLKLLQSPDAKFRTRTYWFDPKTGLEVGYKCGCRSQKHEYWIEYPAPESLPRELFRFEVPRGATLEVNDPELGRQVYSEGQKGPDLRPPRGG